jgi:hypothetical protein
VSRAEPYKINIEYTHYWCGYCDAEYHNGVWIVEHSDECPMVQPYEQS